MRIAVVGAGVSGLTAAFLLHRRHEVVVFEASGSPGGHSQTVDVAINGRSHAVDVGFIVFNERTYPNFEKLLSLLDVAWQWSDMSFSVQCEATGLEYNGGSIAALFAQSSNLFRPKFWAMLRDIDRFRRRLPQLASDESDARTLQQFLTDERFGLMFTEKFLIPMGAAIWSAQPADFLRSFPIHFFARFFVNHGFLDTSRPRWKTVVGGSRNYVAALSAPFRNAIRLRTPVRRIVRSAEGCEVQTDSGGSELFDAVVLAVHSDQALAILAEPTPLESNLLSALPYQCNEGVLHTDAAMLPTRRKAWASWNYFIPRPSNSETSPAAVTYYMNMLQSLDCPEPICVTLNRTRDVAVEKILGRFEYHHPVFTPAG